MLALTKKEAFIIPATENLANIDKSKLTYLHLPDLETDNLREYLSNVLDILFSHLAPKNNIYKVYITENFVSKKEPYSLRANPIFSDIYYTLPKGKGIVSQLNNFFLFKHVQDMRICTIGITLLSLSKTEKTAAVQVIAYLYFEDVDLF